MNPIFIQFKDTAGWNHVVSLSRLGLMHEVNQENDHVFYVVIGQDSFLISRADYDQILHILAFLNENRGISLYVVQ